MIKDFYKTVKKNMTKKNIIIFCIAFIFLFSGLLSVMLYGTGNDLLAEYEKSDFVYPEDTDEKYREELEHEAEVKIQEVIEDSKVSSEKEENPASLTDEKITTEDNSESVTKSEIEIPSDKEIKDIEEPKDDRYQGVDKDKMEEDAARIDEKLNTFKASEA